MTNLERELMNEILNTGYVEQPYTEEGKYIVYTYKTDEEGLYYIRLIVNERGQQVIDTENFCIWMYDDSGKMIYKA